MEMGSRVCNVYVVGSPVWIRSAYVEAVSNVNLVSNNGNE